MIILAPQIKIAMDCGIDCFVEKEKHVQCIWICAQPTECGVLIVLSKK